MTRLARGREADVADDHALAAADDELDRVAHLVQLDAEVGEDLRGDALTLAHEPEQQVLGADVVVVKPSRFVLCKDQDFLRPPR